MWPKSTTSGGPEPFAALLARSFNQLPLAFDLHNLKASRPETADRFGEEERTKMKTKLFALLLLASSSLFAGTRVFVGFGVGVGPAYGYYAAPPPPAPVVAYAAPAPGPGYVWINGYYYPAGPRWCWRPGYWAPRPYAGAYWVGPHYYSHRYYAGYWRR